MNLGFLFKLILLDRKIVCMIGFKGSLGHRM